MGTAKVSELKICNLSLVTNGFEGFANGKKIIRGQIRRNYVQKPSMCGNPELEAATPMCSEAGWNEREEEGKIYCHYHGER